MAGYAGETAFSVSACDDFEQRGSMTKYRLEYIWLDGYTPTPNLRGKTQIKEFASFPTLEQLPLWGFDGSSTQQAEGHNSDCVLKPVAVFPDGARTNGVLVMCEVMMPDGKTPHPSNKRATILDDADAWFGFEQEYFFYKDGRPLGFPPTGYPAPQGPYYTGVGYKNVGDIARKLVEEHLDLCLAAGINHEGINAEVAKGQWEFQIFGMRGLDVAAKLVVEADRARTVGNGINGRPRRGIDRFAVLLLDIDLLVLGIEHQPLVLERVDDRKSERIAGRGNGVDGFLGIGKVIGGELGDRVLERAGQSGPRNCDQHEREQKEAKRSDELGEHWQTPAEVKGGGGIAASRVVVSPINQAAIRSPSRGTCWS